MAIHSAHTSQQKKSDRRIERRNPPRLVDVRGGTVSVILAIIRESFTHPFQTSIIRRRAR
jgi:hypothetical protein